MIPFTGSNLFADIMSVELNSGVIKQLMNELVSGLLL